MTPAAIQPSFTGYVISMLTGALLLAFWLVVGGRAACATIGEPVFEWMARRPAEASLFNDAMIGIHGGEQPATADAYPFAGTVIDVGGGSGNMIVSVLKRHPAVRGVVFDMPHVVAEAARRLTAEGLDDRGSVVVLTFSGDWCGACRGEYPYHRLLLELYKDQPFALLGISSDTDLEAARKAKEDRGLTYRMWWDGGESGSRKEGAIATSWGVGGWPTVYVLDKRGKIRFVNLRQEDLLKGVKQLMSESR